MSFLVLAALFASLFLTCSAIVVAFEARRLCETRKFWGSLAFAIPLVAVTLVLIVVGTRHHVFDPRVSDHFGFDPDWHCVTSGAKGASFCYRDANGAPLK